jgi:TatA/E family protein of Tat protein translocase
MPFVGTGHLWLLGIVLVIVLIIWGPGKLPDVGSGMGRAIREFRKASSETKDQFAAATRADGAPPVAGAGPEPVTAEPEPVAATSSRTETA